MTKVKYVNFIFNILFKASYFALKKKKLQEQFVDGNTQDNKDLDEQSRSLFKSIGIFVNGYTNPTSIELKTLMHRYGGRFYDYPNEGITHFIANNLAYSKAVAFKNKLVVRPEWIVDWLIKCHCSTLIL